MTSPFYLLNNIPWIKKIIDRQYEKRADQIYKRISKYLNKTDVILDVGTGSGFVAAKIGQKLNKKLTCVDVKLNKLNKSKNVILYDGKKLPFNNNSFDVVLLMTVLHHCSKPLQVLDEAVRVSSDRVIIMEDLFETKIEKIITFIEDSIVNWEFMGHPHSNKDEKGWLRAFKRRNLKLINLDKFKIVCAGFPFRIGIFILKKTRRK